jgi:predicted kinase
MISSPKVKELDATFRRAEERRKALEVARWVGVEVWVVECTLPEKEVRCRLRLRLQGRSC